jgi:hypothetical protein
VDVLGDVVGEESQDAFADEEAEGFEAMNEQESDRAFFPKLGRALGSSPIWRAFLAVLAVLLFTGLAVEAWLRPEDASAVLASWLIFCGLKCAWRLLPIRERVRAAMMRSGKDADRCWPCRLRWLIWFGPGFAAAHFWGHRHDYLVDAEDSLLGAGLSLLGLLGYAFCARAALRGQKRLPEER